MSAFRIVGEISVDWSEEFARTRWFRFGLALFVTICLTLLVKDALAATVVFNDGRTCPLPAYVNVWTSPLHLPVCSRFYVCTPDGTKYTPDGNFIVQAACADDRVFANSFGAQP